MMSKQAGPRGTLGCWKEPLNDHKSPGWAEGLGLRHPILWKSELLCTGCKPVKSHPTLYPRSLQQVGSLLYLDGYVCLAIGPKPKNSCDLRLVHRYSSAVQVRAGMNANFPQRKVEAVPVPLVIG